MDFKDLRAQCAPAQIVAVSKLQSEEKMRQLYLAGQRSFGENYVQEALVKMPHLQDLADIDWHFIGHLQKNKAKSVVGKFALIHSVDSLSLAQLVSRLSDGLKIQQKILLQVNLAGESTKEGFNKNVLLNQWSELQRLPGIRICGLMTMPPLTEEGKEVRLHFRELRQILDQLRRGADLKSHPLTELSMGTSHDYQVAIEEGATIVRLGTILFGERPAKG